MLEFWAPPDQLHEPFGPNMPTSSEKKFLEPQARHQEQSAKNTVSKDGVSERLLSCSWSGWGFPMILWWLWCTNRVFLIWLTLPGPQPLIAQGGSSERILSADCTSMCKRVANRQNALETIWGLTCLNDARVSGLSLFSLHALISVATRKRAEYGFEEYGFKHRTQWVFWGSSSSGERTQWVPLSLLFVCQSELTEFFAELTKFAPKLSEAQWVLSSETVLSKRYSARFLAAGPTWSRSEA